MAIPRVVITDCDHPTVAPEREVLAGRAELSVHQENRAERLPDLCREADGIITQYGAFTRDVLGSLSRCRVIARYGVGVDTVDVAAATAQGIVIANVPDYGTDEVSTHAVALVLALHRRIVTYDRSVRAGRWDFQAGGAVPRLRGLVLGVVGFGRIGRMAAEKLRPFGLRCLVADPYVDPVPDWVERVERDELLRRADIVTLHCPLTPETRHLIDARALALMKPSAILVNTARGGLVDTEALVEALEARRIAGAGLDVLEREPLAAGDRLTALDAAVLTPHAAFYSEDAIVELKRKTAQAVLDALEGRRPASVVNPEVYGRGLRTAPA